MGHVILWVGFKVLSSVRPYNSWFQNWPTVCVTNVYKFIWYNVTLKCASPRTIQNTSTVTCVFGFLINEDIS